MTVFARRIESGVEISRQPAVGVAVVVGPPGRLAFALKVAAVVWRDRRHRAILVQGYGLAAVAANLAGRVAGIAVTMLVCSPVEVYYRCRLTNPEPGKPFRAFEVAILVVLAWINARVGRQYVVLSAHLEGVVRGHGTKRPVHRIAVYGVDLNVFSMTGEPKPALRARLGLPAADAFVFFSSRVAPEKDTRTLVRALRLLAMQGRDVRVLHRSGGYRRFLDLAQEYGVVEWVVATDALHPTLDLASSYRACDVCVQASVEEGLGFSVLEAIACGTPVVAAHVGGLRETIVDGLTGWSYPPGDAEALARCIAEAIDYPHDARERVSAGRELVAKQFERRDVFARLARLLGASTESDGATSAETF